MLLLLVLIISAPLAAKPVLNQATAAHVRPATSLAASMAVPANTLALRVDTPDGPLDLLLAPATQMQAQAAPMVPAIRDGRTRLYRGTVVGQPTSWVASASSTEHGWAPSRPKAGYGSWILRDSIRNWLRSSGWAARIP